MQLLSGNEKNVAEKFIERAKLLAQKSTCTRARCGAILVKDDEVIGEGVNSPADGDEKQRRCENDKNCYDQKVTDKTCCVHAERRSIMDALSKNPDKIKGSILYFARFLSDGELRLNGGNGGKNQLYCTMCTKMMYDVGVEAFVLPNINGVAHYSRDEYLDKSYAYGKHTSTLKQ